MKKTVSLSNSTIEKLRQISEEQSINQSAIIETALTIYFMIHYGSPEQAQVITNQVNQFKHKQIDIYDELAKLKK